MSHRQMDKDEDTAYDEVLDDLMALAQDVTDKNLKAIIESKLRQLRRLIDGGKDEEED